MDTSVTVLQFALFSTVTGDSERALEQNDVAGPHFDNDEAMEDRVLQLGFASASIRSKKQRGSRRLRIMF